MTDEREWTVTELHIVRAFLKGISQGARWTMEPRMIGDDEPIKAAEQYAKANPVPTAEPNP